MPFAIEMTAYGPPEVLRPVDKAVPQLRADEVLIEVIATALNRSDVNVRSGHHPILKPNPFPYIPGIETLGTVCAKGSAVTLPIGARVITMMQKMGGVHAHRPGGYQSHVVTPADTVAVLDPHVDPVDMAALGLAAVTAYQGLKRTGLKAGDRILITGASGGVGSAALALAKAWGASAIAVTSNPLKQRTLHDLGADEAWKASDESWEGIRTAPVDAVLDLVGGNTFRHCVQSLKPHGTLCVVGALGGGDATFSVWDLLDEIHLTGYSSERLTGQELGETVMKLENLLRHAKLRVPPVTRYAMRDAARAHADMERGAIIGRQLLIP